MDERKNNIRELEEKNSADSEARKLLLEGLGETLISRIGEEEPFRGKAGTIPGVDTPGAVLEEYRQLQKEIAESSGIITSLEADSLKLKELEAVISEKEKELSRFEKEREEVNANLGKLLLPDPEFENLAGSSKQQEENLLAKIEDLEKKLEDLGEQGKGFLAWLGKNAQMAVSKNLLQRNRSSLQRLYRSIGAKFLSVEQEKTLDGEAAETLEKARELREQTGAIDAELTQLKGERKKITDLFGVEGAPSRRITALEKRIAYVKGLFPGIYLKFGSLAAENTWTEVLSPFINKDDSEVLEKAELINSKIAERELGIRKINAAISIDKKKAEIEKLTKAIEGQKEKIQFAGEAITGYEKQIAQTEQQIEELKTFLQKNG